MYVNSPYFFNIASSRQVIRIKKIINFTWGYGLDITKNSQDYQREKCMLLVRRINFQILGVKRIIECTYSGLSPTITKINTMSDGAFCKPASTIGSAEN